MSAKPISAKTVSAVKGQTTYPPPFDQIVAGRTKRKLGNLFELTNFGVNLTTLAPGAISSLFHSHSAQDEFLYILQGSPSIRIENKTAIMHPGDCIGFKAGNNIAHQVINNSDSDVQYLEIGDRMPGDSVNYPDDDIKASLSEGGQWIFTKKNGAPFHT